MMTVPPTWQRTNPTSPTPLITIVASTLQPSDDLITASNRGIVLTSGMADAVGIDSNGRERRGLVGERAQEDFPWDLREAWQEYRIYLSAHSDDLLEEKQVCHAGVWSLSCCCRICAETD